MSVCCVLVTYGDRAYLLEQVVNILTNEEKVTGIIIVNNCSVGNSRNKIEQLQNFFPSKVRVVHLDENYGSAKGYKNGLMEACKCYDCDFIYLLDDDNKPDPNALNVLVNTWENTGMENKEKRLALLSFRKNRELFVRVASGKNVNKCFPLKNSVLGFNILTIFAKIIHRIGRYRSKKGLRLLDKVVVPYAPYGGLFFHKNLLEVIGFPNEDFVLYHDDSEFTHRITRSGGKIYLVTKSVIEDIDAPWYKNEKAELFSLSYILDGSNSRVYYAVRNKVYFYHKYLTNNKLAWWLNKLLCLFILRLVSVLYNKGERYTLVKEAISAGISGKLGRYDGASL